MKFILMLVLIGVTAQGQKNQGLENKDQDGSVSSQRALEAFSKIHQTFTHRRCTNCHSTSSQPLMGEKGRKHAMYIHSNAMCTTCHQLINSPQKYGPPGAPHWSMPSSAKAFSSKTSPRSLCEQIKDPAKNFFESGQQIKQPRNLDDLIVHLQTDPLVKWSWDPGQERRPAPGTHQQFISLVKTWVKGGAPCPQ